MQWLLSAIYFPKNQIQENYNFKSLINMLKVKLTSGRHDIGVKFNWLGKRGWENDEHYIFFKQHLKPIILTEEIQWKSPW